ncbi:MAG: hypothetical protein J6B19_03380, partial [Lachnospiraceae bacterium]|nr:hypothetical protein [Lachnospiraceae bacterium]
MDEFRLEDLIDEEEDAYEEQRRLERRRRRMEMRQMKERQERIRRIVKVALPCVAIVLVLLIAKIALSGKEPEPVEKEPAKVYAPGQGDLEAEKQALVDVPEAEETIAEGDAMAETASDGNGTLDSTDPATGETASSGGYTAVATENTASVPGEVVSSYAIMVNPQTGEIMAQKNAKTIINPASMTKVLTVLVAAEHVTDLDDTFTITQEITDYSFKNDCSNVGWEVGEVVTVRDLFFGTVLPSGGDAA